MQGRTLEINSIFHQEIKTNIKPHKALFSGHLTLQAPLLCAVPDKALPDPSGSLQRLKVMNEKIILGLRPVGSSLAPCKGFSTGHFGGAVDQEPSARCGHQGPSSLPAPAQIPMGNVSHAKESIFLARQAFLNTPAHVPFMHVINRALKMMHHLLFQKTGRIQKSCCKS